METEKISHPKIAIKAFLLVVIMALIIFVINSWPNIKQSFAGDVPPFHEWYFFKTSNLIFLLLFGIYFYYRDWASQKEALKNQKSVEAKHQSWLDAE